MMENRDRMNEQEISFVANKVLLNFMRDKNLFANYSLQYDDKFLTDFQRRIQEMENLESIDQFDAAVDAKRQKITNYIGHYQPILNITEALIHKSIDENGLEADSSEFYLNELRECLRKRKVWETMRYTRLLIRKIEYYMEQLASKDVFVRIISDLHLFTENLRRAELEYAEAVHMRDMSEIEHSMTRNQLQQMLDAIFDTSAKIFASKSDAIKMNDYSIEKIMADEQFKRMLPH